MPTVSIRVMNIALSEFAKAVNPGNKKRILLLVDRAGFHTGKALVIPDGIEFVYLPPYTPELEPAARIWPLLRESVANRVFKTLDALEAVLVRRCRWLLQNWEVVQQHVGFEWICKTEKQHQLG